MQKRFKIIATIGVISLLVICWFSAAARACCVGTQPPCKVCEQQPGGEWIWVWGCAEGQVCCDGECVQGDCCNNSDCNTPVPYCKPYDNVCVECFEDSHCATDDCYECNSNNECEYACSEGDCCDGEGNCVGGCEECEECVEWSPGSYKCEHKCLNCESPEYCVDACYCTDCSTEEDNDLCSESKGDVYVCPGCTVHVIEPCSSYEKARVYTGNAKITCSSSYDDCEEQDDPVCYTEYLCRGNLNNPLPFHLCGIDYPPGPPTGQVCKFYGFEYPLFCTQCEKDPTDEGDPHYTEETTCPSEEWPP